MTNNLFRSSDAKLIIIVAIYRLALDYIFKNVLVVYYSYYTFIDNSSASTRIISWIILLFFSLLASYTYKDTRTVTNQVLFLLFLISFVPFTTMVGYGNFEYKFVIANCVYFFVLYLFNRYYGRRSKYKIVLKIPSFVGETQLKIIAVLSYLVVLYISGRYAGFRFSMGLAQSLDWRYAAREYSMSTVFRYLFSWTRTINSILMVYFIIKKKPVWVVACVVVQILAYGVNGMKFTLFLGILTVIIACLPKFDVLKVGHISLLAFVGVGAACIIEFVVFHSPILSSLVVMRMFFIPNMIGARYFEFFTTHTPDYFRGSFLRHFGFSTPYPNLGFLITEYFKGDPLGRSNDGLIADAMTNYGYIGIIIAPILLIVVFRILDKTMDGLDVRIKVAQAVSLALQTISTFLLPLLLTDGLLVMMILFSAMKKEKLKTVTMNAWSLCERRYGHD
jgi:hypothetical protein